MCNGNMKYLLQIADGAMRTRVQYFIQGPTLSDLPEMLEKNREFLHGVIQAYCSHCY